MTKPFEIPKALVWKAFQRVRSNGGSAGIDQESLAVFERNLGNNLYKIWNRMGSGSYFPPPVKAVPIPKKNGGTRTLGVPIVASECLLLSRRLECRLVARVFGGATCNCSVGLRQCGLARRG